MMVQFNLLKYRVSVETRNAAANINGFVCEKISGIGILKKGYDSAIGYLYKLATGPPGA